MIAVCSSDAGKSVVLQLGDRRGLVFYLCAVRTADGLAEVDVFCRPEQEFAVRFTLFPTSPIRAVLAAYHALDATIQGAAAVQIAYLTGIAKKRPADWSNGELRNNERRNQPKLVKGRKPKKVKKLCTQPAPVSVDSYLGQAADKHSRTTNQLESTMTAKKTPAKKTPIKVIKGKADAAPAEKKTKAKVEAEVAAPAEKKTKAKVEAAPEAEAAGTRGRKRDGELYDSKVQATEKVAKEGTFYADVQAQAKKPIKLSALIEKMGELHPDTADLKHHQRAAAKTVDSLKRMGYIALV